MTPRNDELCALCGQRRGDHSMISERCPSRAMDAHVHYWAEDTFTPRQPAEELPHEVLEGERDHHRETLRQLRRIFGRMIDA